MTPEDEAHYAKAINDLLGRMGTAVAEVLVVMVAGQLLATRTQGQQSGATEGQSLAAIRDASRLVHMVYKLEPRGGPGSASGGGSHATH